MTDWRDDVINGKAPPPWAIEAAVNAGRQSPCSKSKRGAAIYCPEEALRIITQGHLDSPAARRGNVLAADHNSPPGGFQCTGSAQCRSNCAKFCLHAEQRALMSAMSLTELDRFEMVHTKVVDGVLVAGGPPSCWQCSRLVLDSGIAGIWLYEKTFLTDHDDGSPSFVAKEGEPAWKFYKAHVFHQQTLKNTAGSRDGELLYEPAADLAMGLYSKGDCAPCTDNDVPEYDDNKRQWIHRIPTGDRLCARRLNDRIEG